MFMLAQPVRRVARSAGILPAFFAGGKVPAGRRRYFPCVASGHERDSGTM